MEDALILLLVLAVFLFGGFLAAHLGNLPARESQEDHTRHRFYHVSCADPAAEQQLLRFVREDPSIVLSEEDPQE